MEITVKDLLKVLKKSLIYVIVCSLLLGVLFFSYTSLFVQKVYQSTLEFVLLPQTTSSTAGGSQINDLNNNLAVGSKTISTLGSYLMNEKTTTALLNFIAERHGQIPGDTEYVLDYKYSPKQLNNLLSFVSASDDEVNLVFSVRCKAYSSKDCRVILDAFAKIVNERSEKILDGVFRIEPCEPPHSGSRISPNVTLNTIIGIVLGAAIPYVLVLIHTTKDTRIKSEENVKNKFKHPILGQIPSIRSRAPQTTENEKKRGNLKDKAKRLLGVAEHQNTHLNHKINLINEKTATRVTEAYSMTRTNLFYMGEGKNGKMVLGFTGTMPNEGKSLTCANTAISFALSGKKVLLIDCDLRKPTQKEAFDATTATGLSEYLAGVTEEPEIFQTSYENLSLLTSGRCPPNPAELLCRERFGELISNCQEKYDCVFVDLPPVSMISDAAIVAPHIHAYVLVLRLGRSDTRMLQTSIEAIERANGKIAGYILNTVDDLYGIRHRRGDSYGSYRYHYQYKYYEKYYKSYGAHASQSAEKAKENGTEVVEAPETVQTPALPEENSASDVQQTQE